MGAGMKALGSNLASNFQDPSGTNPTSVLKGIGNTMDIYGAQGKQAQQQGGQQPAQPVNFGTPQQPYVPPPQAGPNPFAAMQGGGMPGVVPQNPFAAMRGGGMPSAFYGG
jgi:hypothetical protein